MDEPLRFVRKGLSLYHVFGGDVQLGWMDDRTIALFGYDTSGGARWAGATAYAAAVGWHAAPTHDARAAVRWRNPDAVAPEYDIEVDGEVVGRVVCTPSHECGKGRYGFELARAPGQTFAASVHQFHRLLAIGRPPSVQAERTPLATVSGSGRRADPARDETRRAPTHPPGERVTATAPAPP